MNNSEVRDKINEVKKEMGWYPTEEQPNTCQHCRSFVSSEDREAGANVHFGQVSYVVCHDCYAKVRESDLKTLQENAK